MPTVHEVVPGRSIGSFTLGMTRREIEDLDIRPMSRDEQGGSIYFPLIQITEAEMSRREHPPHPGLTVNFDDRDHCCGVSALFAYEPKPPIFALGGKTLNGMTLEAAADLLRSIATDVRISFGTARSDSAGVSVGMWERDEAHIMNASVMPASS